MKRIKLQGPCTKYCGQHLDIDSKFGRCSRFSSAIHSTNHAAYPQNNILWQSELSLQFFKCSLKESFLMLSWICQGNKNLSSLLLLFSSLFHLSRYSEETVIMNECFWLKWVTEAVWNRLVLVHGPVLLKNTRTYRQEGINRFMNYILWSECSEIVPLVKNQLCSLILLLLIELLKLIMFLKWN